jgi:hypothetical protein
LFLRSGTNAERSDRWLATEEIWAPAVDHEEAWHTFGLGLFVVAQET